MSGVNIYLDLNITLSDLTGLVTLPASVPRLTREAAEVTAVAAVTFCWGINCSLTMRTWSSWVSPGQTRRGRRWDHSQVWNSSADDVLLSQLYREIQCWFVEDWIILEFYSIKFQLFIFARRVSPECSWLGARRSGSWQGEVGVWVSAGGGESGGEDDVAELQLWSRHQARALQVKTTL